MISENNSQINVSCLSINTQGARGNLKKILNVLIGGLLPWLILPSAVVASPGRSHNFYEIRKNIVSEVLNQDTFLQSRPSIWELYQSSDSGFGKGMKIQKGLSQNVIDIRKQTDQKQQADVLLNQGIEQYRRGQLRPAQQTMEQALNLFYEIGDKQGEFTAISMLGAIYDELGDYARAIDLYQQSLEFSRNNQDQQREAFFLAVIGEAYYKLSDYTRAIESYQHSLEIYYEITDRQGEATVLEKLGIVYYSIDEYSQAVTFQQQSLDIKREIGDRRGEASSLGLLGIIYFSLADYTRSIGFHQKSLEIHREIGDRQRESLDLESLGKAYYGLYEYLNAINFFQQSLIIKREIDDQQGEAELLGLLGATYEELSEYPRAIESYQQSLDIYREIGGQWMIEARLLGSLGTVYYEISEYKRAIDFQIQSLTIKREIHDRQGEANSLNALGLIYQSLSDYTRAIDFFQQSLAITRETANRLGEANALGNLGMIYHRLGDYTRAIDLHQQSLTIKLELGDRQGEANSLGNLGNTNLRLGAYDRAINLLEQTLAITREIGDLRGEAIALGNLGVIYHEIGDYTRAVNLMEEQLKITREIGDRVSEANALGGLGTSNHGLERYAYAIESYQQALDIYREIDNRRGEAGTLANLGRTYSKLEEYDNAIEFYRQSLAITREIGNRPDEARSLIGFAYAWLEIDELHQAEIHFQSALSLLESIRDQDLLDAQKVSLLDTQLSAYSGLEKVYIAQNKLEAALEVSERGRARAFAERLQSRFIDTDESTFPNIAEIKMIAQRQQATLIEYSLIGDQALYIWIVSPKGKVSFRKVDISDISLVDLVINSRDAIGARGRARATVVPVSTEASRKKQEANLKQLHQLLIDPIADFLPTDETHPVIFIPQGELFLVPFAALIDENNQFLIEKHTLLTAPSIQVLDLTHQQKANLGPLNLDTLAPSDAFLLFHPSMPEIYDSKSGTGHLVLALSGAGQEAQAIGSYLGITPLLGDAANEATIKAQLTNARLIHLATHGLLDYGDPQETGIRDIPGALALAPTDTEDGLLTTAELLEMDLQADLVVLSACDTGRGTITGDGVVGLSRGLITAGVPSVIVSLWKVPDQSTSFLMTRFYENWRTSGNKAQALRQAMLTTLQQEQYRDPVHWSAFTLIGEQY